MNENSGNESFSMMEKRHKLEKAELEEKSKILLKAAKKSTKAQIEYQIIQMGYDLKAKHMEEEDEYEGRNNGAVEIVEPEILVPTVEPNTMVESIDNSAEAKKAKAKRKQEKKAQKEVDRQLVKEQIKDSQSGPSLREIELERIASVLKNIGCEMKHITSDGNCLYRSIADQINLSGLDVKIPQEYATPSITLAISPTTSAKNGAVTFQVLRVIAANYIRQHSEDFTPYLEMSSEDPEFAAYCDKVESDVLCEWGGQLEIKAICAALGVQIHVYSADSPVLVMGTEESRGDSSPPLRISFHRHYFALGEHYNSVISSNVSGVFSKLSI